MWLKSTETYFRPVPNITREKICLRQVCNICNLRLLILVDSVRKRLLVLLFLSFSCLCLYVHYWIYLCRLIYLSVPPSVRPSNLPSSHPSLSICRLLFLYFFFPSFVSSVSFYPSVYLSFRLSFFLSFFLYVAFLFIFPLFSLPFILLIFTLLLKLVTVIVCL